jgi:aminoglycoside phosphotransferase (APT) family kinase protein
MLLDAGETAPAWEEIVELYADVQMELVDEVGDLLALGVPDSRPEALGAHVGGPVPLTLIHEEVHDGNVFVRDGSPVFIDWAEASISHPFAGLVNTLRMYTYRYDYEPGGPEVLALRDAYLGRWTEYAPLDELRELFASAYALGALARAATWERLLLSLPPAQREDYEHNIGAWREIHADALRAPDRLGE